VDPHPSQGTCWHSGLSQESGWLWRLEIYPIKKKIFKFFDSQAFESLLSLEKLSLGQMPLAQKAFYNIVSTNVSGNAF
jgi:hypothetical protein